MDSTDGVNKQKLQDVRRQYHKNWWCHLQRFQFFKGWNAILNGTALLIMALAMLVGSVWENSFAMIALTTAGTLVKGWADFKKFPNKVEMSKFAYTTYAKCLIEINTYINGVELNDLQAFLTKMQTIEDIVIDMAPPFTQKCSQKYDKQNFTSLYRSENGSIDISDSSDV